MAEGPAAGPGDAAVAGQLAPREAGAGQLAPPESGGPIRLIHNPAAGEGSSLAGLLEALRPHGREVVVLPAEPAQLAACAAQAARLARADGGVVAAIGGDGTLNTVAQCCWAEGVAMAVVPAGTFNYFARAHGLDDDPQRAARAICAGRPQPVQLGMVHERVVLVNASVGLYPRLIEDREAWKARLGRSRWVALMAAAATLWQGMRPMRLRLEGERASTEHRSITVLVGNNPLQFERLGLPQSQAVGRGWLGLVHLRPLGRWKTLGLLLRGAAGRLGEMTEVDTLLTTRMDLHHLGGSLRRPGRIKVAIDGETHWMRLPLAFRVAPKPLWLCLPTGPGSNGAAA